MKKRLLFTLLIPLIISYISVNQTKAEAAENTSCNSCRKNCEEGETCEQYDIKQNGGNGQKQETIPNDLNTQTQTATESAKEVPNENASEVAKYVHELLEQDIEGGIGEQVRLVAQAQNQSQQELTEQVEKMQNRSNFMKNLFGPDYKAIKSIESLMEQNRERVQALQNLSQQTQNESEQQNIQLAVKAIEEQNTELQEQIKLEKQIKSLFGWLFELFAF